MVYDYHVHTTFADGKNSVSEVADAAFSLGMKALGFSEHSYVAFDTSCGLLPEKTKEYRYEVNAVRDAYRGTMSVFCGIEADYYTEIDLSPFDYRIGSVHYLKLGDRYRPVDLSPVETQAIVTEEFGGDPYAYAAYYFETLSSLFARIPADIIGHFDLITKFTERVPLLDATDVRYRRSWQGAVDALLPFGKPFEINTGAISRGYRASPYPAVDILCELQKRGARIILSSDSHRKDTLGCSFAQAKEIARACGFVSRVILTETGWQEIDL